MTVINMPKLCLIFLFFSILIRWPSFFPSVMDHDESTYLVIGRDIMNGKILYHDVTDIKPVGIFLISGIILKITNNSIFAFRLFTAAVVGLTAFFISLLLSLFIKNRSVVIASGFIYIFFCSIWTFFGVSPNTELFFNLFVVAGAYILLKQQRFIDMFLAGLLWGVGFMIKYVMAFDVTAIMLFLIIQDYKQQEKLISVKKISKYFLVILGFIIPLLSVITYYKVIGHLDDFRYINVEVLSNYSSDRNIGQYIWYLFVFHVRFLPIFLFFYYALYTSKGLFKDIKLLAFLWLSFTVVSVYLPGNFFGHYTIQLMIPVSIISSIFFYPGIRKHFFLIRITSGKIGRLIFVVITLGIITSGIFSYILAEDIPRKIAKYVENNTTSEDVIYTGNYYQIIYLLCNKTSPTPYVHNKMIFADRLKKAMGIDENKEVKKIMDTKPEIIIVKEEFPNNYLNNQLKLFYKPVKTFKNVVKIFKRIE